VAKIEKILAQSARVCSYWTFLARTMGLKTSILNDIKREMNYSGGVEYAIHVILESWIDQCGNKATFAKLIKYLESEGMNRTAGRCNCNQLSNNTDFYILTACLVHHFMHYFFQRMFEFYGTVLSPPRT
jgi:hypothetical protein